MLATRFAEVAPTPMIRAVTAKTLRNWCMPEVILVVTDLTDEMAILPHAIKQVRQSHAKIVLAHVVTPQKDVSVIRTHLIGRPTSRLQEARSIVERMARQLRWLGFTCEPLVFTGDPDSEIPLIAKNCCADRVIIALDTNSDPASVGLFTGSAQLLPNLDVPTCVIGRHVSAAGLSALPRNVTLAVSLDSDCDVPLAFACRFAQELRAKLTVLHVTDRDNCDFDPAPPSSLAIASRLPNPTWREAQLFCPTEIVVRQGEPAEEIRKHSGSAKENFIILCSPGASFRSDGRTNVSSRVLAEAQCPVLVLQKQAEHSNNNDSVLEAQKVRAYGEIVRSAVSKEQRM